MAEFLDDILEERQNILTMDSQSGIIAELCKEIRETPFDELTTDQKRELMFLLLKQLQPFLSAANLSHGISPEKPIDPTAYDDTQNLTVQDEMPSTIIGQSQMQSKLTAGHDTTPTVSELMHSYIEGK